jgi:hypothetical protein
LDQGDDRTSLRASFALGIGFFTVLGARLLAIPKSHWELDEWLFRMGVERFAPLEHHPHPPGYPLLIGLGKAVDLVVGDPFLALVVLATASSILTYLALADAFHHISGDVWVGIAGALLFSLSPAMMVHSTTPMSDPPALLFLAIALAAGARLDRFAAPRSRASSPHDGDGAPVDAARSSATPAAEPSFSARWRERRHLAAPILFGAALSASIGYRPQYAIALVPMLLAGCIAMRQWRARAASLAAFSVTSLAWLVPLVVACAGWDRFVQYQRTQIATVASADAFAARGPRSWIDLGQRFLFDGWGAPAWASAILGLARLGRGVSIAQRRGAVIPLLVMALVHLVFTLVSSDPADGVRYALPVEMATAFLAAMAIGAGASVLAWPRTVLFAVVSLIAAISLRYTLPVIDARRTSPAPPVQAADWARDHLPLRAVILPDPSLRPHADLLMKRFRRFRPTDGLQRFWNRPNVPLWELGPGPTEIEGAMMFSWPYSDAYARLTRNHYRVVALAPIGPERRYREVTGLYPLEWVAHRREWRWLAPEAKLEIAPGQGPLEVELELSPDPPYASTSVEFLADGVEVAEGSVERGKTATICVPMPARGGLLTIRSSEFFVPAEVGAGRDDRKLAVQLLDLVRRPELQVAPGCSRYIQG